MSDYLQIGLTIIKLSEVSHIQYKDDVPEKYIIEVCMKNGKSINFIRNTPDAAIETFKLVRKALYNREKELDEEGKERDD